MTWSKRIINQKPFIINPFAVIFELVSPAETDWGALKGAKANEVNQLDLELKKDVLNQIHGLNKAKLILSGGDLFRDPDFLEIIEYAKSLNLRIEIRPTISNNTYSYQQLAALKKAGITSISINLDSYNSIDHDLINGAGSFDESIRVISQCKKLNIPVQINTALTKKNLRKITEIAEEVKLLQVDLWNVVLTLKNEEELLSPTEAELFYQWLYDFGQELPFDIKTVSGQQFHRVTMQNKRREGKLIGSYIHFRDTLLKGYPGLKAGIERSPYVLNDGKGILFINYKGDVYPSSMLALKVGNVKRTSLREIYRKNPLIKELHNSDLVKGKCGICEYRNICGGNRARAYLVTGDYLQSDPICFYKPNNLYRVN